MEETRWQAVPYAGPTSGTGGGCPDPPACISCELCIAYRYTIQLYDLSTKVVTHMYYRVGGSTA